MYAYSPPSYEKVDEVPKAKRRAQFARRFAPAQLKETLRSTSPTLLSCRGVCTRGVRPPTPCKPTQSLFLYCAAATNQRARASTNPASHITHNRGGEEETMLLPDVLRPLRPAHPRAPQLDRTSMSMAQRTAPSVCASACAGGA